MTHRPKKNLTGMVTLIKKKKRPSPQAATISSFSTKVLFDFPSLLLAGTRLMHYQKMVLCADEKTKQTHTGFLHLIITKLNLSFSQAQDRNTSGRPPLEWQTAHTCASHLHVGGQPCGPFPGAGRRTHRRRLGEPLGKYLVVLELCRAPRPPGGGGWPGGLLSLCERTLPSFVGDLRPRLGQLCAPIPAFPGQGPSLSLRQPCPNGPVSAIQGGCLVPP